LLNNLFKAKFDPCHGSLCQNAPHMADNSRRSI
jgi:hypothetical protein